MSREVTVPVYRYDSEEEYQRHFGFKADPAESPREFCDFCCEREARWTYPAEDFPMQVIRVAGADRPHWSQGAWACCGECAEFVDAGDLDGLVVCSSGQWDPAVRPTLRELYALFFEARTGPKVDSAILKRTCPHPQQYLRANRDTLGTLNPRHHSGILCTLCGTNLAPELFHVRDGWHRRVGLRVTTQGLLPTGR